MDNSQLSIDVLMSFLEPGRGVEPLPGGSSFILLYGLDSLSCEYQFSEIQRIALPYALEASTIYGVPVAGIIN